MSILPTNMVVPEQRVLGQDAPDRLEPPDDVHVVGVEIGSRRSR